ncbi:OmpA/MotB family protein [Allohahella marinimesophila]|uniref:OmpA family protein n=1 Tax=Allohahella marinimesophila TaxID=1054972 RepID=A0ABP7Q528_9GAMM
MPRSPDVSRSGRLNRFQHAGGGNEQSAQILANSHLGALDDLTVQDNEGDAWLTSYLDVFVLITAVFALMLAIQAQPITETEEKNITPTTGEPVLSELELIQPIIPAQITGSREQNAWYQSIRDAVNEQQLEGFLSPSFEEGFAELEIGSNVLFDSGDAVLLTSGEDVLRAVVPILQKSSGAILIEGHTDSTPIQTARFSSNWDLAASRATEVLQFLAENGIEGPRLRAISYGDTKPMAPNDTEDNRAKNRRVSLVIQAP